METTRIQNSILKWVSQCHKTAEEIRQNVYDDLGQFVSNKAFEGYLGIYADNFIFLERDAKNLAEKIMAFFENKHRDEIAESLFERVKSTSSLDSLVDKILNKLAN